MINWSGCCLHHSASRHDNIQIIRHYHIKTLGWQDIGYHFIINRQGELIKGRNLSLGGCHGNREANKTLIGICCLGNFERDKINDIQKKTLFQFLQFLKIIFDWDSSLIFGHKEVRDKPTACPGRFFPLVECKQIFKK